MTKNLQLADLICKIDDTAGAGPGAGGDTRTIFAPPSTRRNFFKCAPPPPLT